MKGGNKAFLSKLPAWTLCPYTGLDRHHHHPGADSWNQSDRYAKPKKNTSHVVSITPNVQRKQCMQYHMCPAVCSPIVYHISTCPYSYADEKDRTKNEFIQFHGLPHIASLLPLRHWICHSPPLSLSLSLSHARCLALSICLPLTISKVKMIWFFWTNEYGSNHMG